MSPKTEKPLSADDLLKMSQQQLDDLFERSQAGPIPNGQAKGTAIIAPMNSRPVLVAFRMAIHS